MAFLFVTSSQTVAMSTLGLAAGNSVTLEGIGGGGGCPDTWNINETGAGGGAYAHSTTNPYTLTSGDVSTGIVFTIGAGGVSQASNSGSNGTNGGDTTIVNNAGTTLVDAGGGGAPNTFPNGAVGGAVVTGTGFAGGGSGNNNGSEDGGGGGGGAGGPNGAGGAGGIVGHAGSGGGGANGGGAGVTANNSFIGTAGGTSFAGVAGGTGGARATTTANGGPGGAGSAGSGGGGGGSTTDTTHHTGGVGGAGSADTTVWDGTHGPGSGPGGGGGAFNAGSGGIGAAGGSQGSSAYGAGGAQGGQGGAATQSATGSNGGPGIAVVTYTVATTTVRVLDEEQHRPRPKLRRPPQPDDFVVVPSPTLNLAVTFSPFTLSATIQVPAGPAPVFGGDEEQHVPHSRRWRPPQNDDPFVLVAAAPITAVYVFDEEHGAPRFGRRRPTQNDDQTPFRQAAWIWQGDEEQHQPRFRRWHVPQNDDPFVPLPITAAVSAAIYVFDEEHGPRFRRWRSPQNDELIVPVVAAPAITTVYVFDEERGQPRRRIWRPNSNEDTLVIPTHKWVWQGDEEQHRPIFRSWRGHGDEGFFLPPLPPAGPSTVILGFDQEYSQPRHRTWRIPQPEDFVPRPSPILTLSEPFGPFTLSGLIIVPSRGGWEEEQHVPRYRRWHPPQNDEPFVLFKRGVLTPVSFGWEEEQHRPRFRPWRVPQPEDFIPVTSPILTLSKTFGPFTLSGLITVPPVFGIGKSNIPPVRLTNPANAPIELWIGQSARTINQILSGKLNATTSVTLTPNATSTVIFDSRIGISSHVTLMPISASAAAALASGQIWFALTKGSVTINHPSSSAVDQTFGVLLIG